MSSCPRVSGRARSSSSIRLPHGCRVESPARCQPLAQTLRPDIGPVLFDVVQTRSAVRFAVDHPPAGWNVGKGRPQAVLLLVVDQDEKAAIVVVERIDAHSVLPDHPLEMSGTVPEANRVGSAFRQSSFWDPISAK